LQGPTGGLILGIGLIVVTFVLPGGVVSGIRQIRGRIVQVIPQTPELAMSASDSAPQAGSTDGIEASPNGNATAAPNTADDG
jgi:branched-chain amino acid transport system permease protein